MRWESRRVGVFNQRREVIAVRARAEPGKFTTNPNHLLSPSRHVIQQSLDYLLDHSRAIGMHTGSWAEREADWALDEGDGYVPCLKSILKPFGVKPHLYNHTSGDIAALFIALEANTGMAVLTEGVLPMFPGALTVCRFSPDLAPLLIAAAMPSLRPSPHAETFLKLLLAEIYKSSRHK